MLYRSLVIFLFLLPTIGLANPDQVQSYLPRESYEVIKYESAGGAVFVNADVDWSAYTRVQLKRGTVEFRENWVEDQENTSKNVIRETDLERVKTDMADLLDKVLRGNLSKREAYTLTDESGADVLLFTPGIVKLDIYTPDFLRDYVGHELTVAQGGMVLVLDISDSVSGRILASAVQKQRSAESGFFESSSRGRNKAAFRRMMQNWNDWLFAMLEKIRAGELEHTIN